MEWSDDFNEGVDFEFNDNELYEIDTAEEYELNGDRYIKDIDGYELRLEMDDYTDETKRLLNIDEYMIKMLLFYAKMLGLEYKYRIRLIDEDTSKISIKLISNIYQAELIASFYCAIDVGSKINLDIMKVDIETELAGMADYYDFKFVEGFQFIMEFIEFAAGEQNKI
jgi:hypothetical protein